MHTWKSHLRSVLFRLSRTHGNNQVSDVERLLCEVFDGRSVRFTDTEGQPLRPDLQLRELLNRGFEVVVTLEHQPHPRNGGRDDGGRNQETTGADSGSRFHAEQTIEPAQRQAWFIREFDRLEQTHDFMWAGYIVKELLPRIGLSTQEAREFLDKLQEDGIVAVRKIPNPRNPEHPASAVEMQRDNAQVREVLGGAGGDGDGSRTPSEVGSAESPPD